MSTTPLIAMTGMKGFLGSFLEKHLSAQNYKVSALDSDILDPATLDAEVQKIKPQMVFHFAGLSNPAQCEQNQKHAHSLNVDGTENLLSALDKAQSPCHVFLASSAQVYLAPTPEEAQSEALFTEDRELRPQNYYAQTKLQAESCLRSYAAGNLSATVLRIFNITDRNQDPTYVLPYLYNEIKKSDSVTTGNLSVARDFLLVADFCQIIEKLVAQTLLAPKPYDVFNISSGKSRKLIDIAEEMKKQLKHPDTRFVTDLGKVRKNDPLIIRGSTSKRDAFLKWSLPVTSTAEFVQRFIES